MYDKVNYFNPFNLNSLCQECESKSDIIVKFPIDNELVGLCTKCYNDFKRFGFKMIIIQKRLQVKRPKPNIISENIHNLTFLLKLMKQHDYDLNCNPKEIPYVKWLYEIKCS